MHVVNDGGTPRTPNLTSFYVIDGLGPYQYPSIHDVLDAAGAALQHGVQPVTIRLVIIDENFPVGQQATPMQQEQLNFTEPTVNPNGEVPNGFDQI